MKKIHLLKCKNFKTCHHYVERYNKNIIPCCFPCKVTRRQSQKKKKLVKAPVKKKAIFKPESMVKISPRDIAEMKKLILKIK